MSSYLELCIFSKNYYLSLKTKKVFVHKWLLSDNYLKLGEYIQFIFIKYSNLKS